MPLPIGPSSAQKLDQLAIDQAKMVNQNLAAIHPVIDPTKPPQQQKNMLNQLGQELQDSSSLVRKDQTDVTEMVKQVDESANLQQAALASSYFNLSKYAQGFMEPGTQNPAMDMSMPMSGETDGGVGSEDPSGQALSFGSPEELKSWLETNSTNPEMINQLLGSVPQDSEYTGDAGVAVNTRQFVKDCAQRFAEAQNDEAQKMILAAQIFEKISGKGDDVIQGTLTKASVDFIVKESESLIKALAFKVASSQGGKKSSYNLKKQAQVAGFVDFVNFGPEDRRMFPYSNTGNIGSYYHTVERAKPHNFNFDDYSVDFETFWRGNIMDKYSRPYRNEKGEYVGGYINKRFEVDRNVPEGNNYQLLPGQKRRPILPEYGLMEARMEASRKAISKERGYNSPTSEKTKAYNWKEAGGPSVSTVKKK